MLREAGIETAQVARAVAVPSILYSVETIGLSDTALNTARSVVSAAGNANTGGRQPDLALAISDGSNRTLDPAFEAHANPIKYWALSVWERWYCQSELTDSISEARKMLSGCKASPWAVVKGPAAAVLLTMKRIGWELIDSASAKDDIQQSWNCMVDSPAAVVNAVCASVRRWRLQRVADLFPRIAPRSADVHLCDSTPTMLMDFVNVLTPLVKKANLRGENRQRNGNPNGGIA